MPGILKAATHFVDGFWFGFINLSSLHIKVKLEPDKASAVQGIHCIGGYDRLSCERQNHCLSGQQPSTHAWLWDRTVHDGRTSGGVTAEEAKQHQSHVWEKHIDACGLMWSPKVKANESKRPSVEEQRKEASLSIIGAAFGIGRSGMS